MWYSFSKLVKRILKCGEIENIGSTLDKELNISIGLYIFLRHSVQL